MESQPTVQQIQYPIALDQIIHFLLFIQHFIVSNVSASLHQVRKIMRENLLLSYVVI